MYKHKSTTFLLKTISSYITELSDKNNSGKDKKVI